MLPKENYQGKDNLEQISLASLLEYEKILYKTYYVIWG